MILMKTTNKSTDFVPFFYHHLQLGTLNFDGPYLLWNMFGTLGFLFSITRFDVFDHPLNSYHAFWDTLYILLLLLLFYANYTFNTAWQFDVKVLNCMRSFYFRRTIYF